MTPQRVLHNLQSVIHNGWTPPANLRFRTLATLLARLSPREQRLVYVASIALGFILLYLLVIDPLWQMQVDMQARVAAKERELQEIVALQQEYLLTKAEVDRAQAAAGANFSPVAFLEDLTNSIVGQEKVLAITPITQENQSDVTIDTIELKLSGVSLRELVDFLYKIDTAGTMLHTSQLSIKKRYKDPYTFDVLLIILAISAR